MKTNAIVILVTTKDKTQAKRIAKGLLDKKLIACANIVADIESMFLWQQKIDKAQETLLILKTTAVLFKKVAQEVKRLHSYDVPEIIALPIAAGSDDYSKWLNSCVKGS